MADHYLRQSPLAHLGLEGRAGKDRGEAGVAMGERAFPGIVDLRGRLETLSPAFEILFGFALPAQPNTTNDNGKTGAKARIEAVCLGPDEWWLLGAEPVKLAALAQGLLLHAIGGEPLGPKQGGPFRLLIPEGVADAPSACASNSFLRRAVSVASSARFGWLM